jgi:hypothetical protein
MSKQSIDRHVETPQTRFTVLIDDPDLKTARAIARDEDRTAGSVVREALRRYLDSRARRKA